MKLQLLASIQALILDMDGVLWRDQQPIGDLPSLFAEMERRGYRVALATNNATLSVTQYQEKLRSFGVSLRPEQIINSPQAAAYYLKKRYPEGGPVYIVGEAGLVDTLAESGFYFAEQDVLAVVAGLDRQLTYRKLSQAAMLIRRGALFIGTNPDRTYPVPNGLAPGAGAILEALHASTDIAPTIVGKPEPVMYQVALERLQAAPARTLVVGDRLETDIQGAQALGCRTALVLSGVTTHDEARAWKPAPDLITKDLTDLIYGEG